MKEYDWSHKMKPSEYEKVKVWCNENGFIDTNLSFTHLTLYIHTFKDDGFCIELNAIEYKFVESNPNFIYMLLEIKSYNALSTDLTNTLSLSRYVSTLDEIKSFIAKKEEFVKMARDFGV